MMNMIDNKSDLMMELEKTIAKIEAIQRLPEYQQFLDYRKELGDWGEFIKNKRLQGMKPLMDTILGDGKLLETWISRIKTMEKRMSDIQWEKGCIGGEPSNVMNLVWEYFQKYGDPVGVVGMFDDESFVINGYTMTKYSGQGEYGYSITKPQKLY